MAEVFISLLEWEKFDGLQWLTLVILATQDAEIRGTRFKVILGGYLKNTQHKTGLVA
jgi:hypothetical protein